MQNISDITVHCILIWNFRFELWQNFFHRSSISYADFEHT